MPTTGSVTRLENLPIRSRSSKKGANMAIMPSMSSTDHGTTCVRCGEKVFVPDWSEFVSERLVVNLWSCSRCGDRFETSACMSEDTELKLIEKDWEHMFPPLLVA